MALQPKAKKVVVAKVSEIASVAQNLGVSHDDILSRPIKSSSLYACVKVKQRTKRAVTPSQNTGIDREMAKVRPALAFIL